MKWLKAQTQPGSMKISLHQIDEGPDLLRWQAKRPSSCHYLQQNT